MRRLRPLLAAVIGLGLLVGACSGGGGEATPVATTTVDLPPSYRFEPEDIVVPAGSTVTWTNHDNFTHSVAFLDGDLPREPLMMEPGQSVTFTFEAPGTYRYQCHLHPQDMRGSVTVTD